MNYIIGHGGKRLSPIMVLMGNELFGGDIEKAIKPAFAIEFFHNFTLIHDDIMDVAPLRTGITNHSYFTWLKYRNSFRRRTSVESLQIFRRSRSRKIFLKTVSKFLLETGAFCFAKVNNST